MWHFQNLPVPLFCSLRKYIKCNSNIPAGISFTCFRVPPRGWIIISQLHLCLRADRDSIEVPSANRDTGRENKKCGVQSLGNTCARLQPPIALERWGRYLYQCQRNRQLRGLSNFFAWLQCTGSGSQVKPDHMSHLFKLGKPGQVICFPEFYR